MKKGGKDGKVGREKGRRRRRERMGKGKKMNGEEMEERKGDGKQ